MMGLLYRHLRKSHPTRFLGVMSLSTGVEIISLFTIFNKLTGFYGLLAILTGFRLSSLQLTMYIYSCLAIVILVYLIPHIRKQSPFQCMLLGYFYLIDTVVNTLFTSAFAVNWFLTATHDRGNISSTSESEISTKAKMYSNKIYNINDTKNILNPINSVFTTQESALYGVASAATSAGTSFEETIPSVALVTALTFIRVYFIFVVLEYARQVLRQNTYNASSSKLHLHTDGCMDVVLGDNLFTISNLEGMRWKERLGRLMITTCEHYWIGGINTDDVWAKGLDNRSRTSQVATEPTGTFERERRARSGTGPPTR